MYFIKEINFPLNILNCNVYEREGLLEEPLTGRLHKIPQAVDFRRCVGTENERKI